jgi:hypothetical protein
VHREQPRRDQQAIAGQEEAQQKPGLGEDHQEEAQVRGGEDGGD